MYEHIDKVDYTRLTVTEHPRGAEVGVKFNGIKNFLTLNQSTAMEFAEAILKEAGAKATVVKHSNEGVLVYPEGKTVCGKGSERVQLAVDADLDSVRRVISNMVTLVDVAERNGAIKAEMDRKRQVALDRERVAHLLDIVVPSDEEGLKALDVLVDRRYKSRGRK